MNHKQTSLPYIVSRFFTVYLPGERGFSETTIMSYRDTFKQLFSFCKSRLGKQPEKLTMPILSRNLIAEFLNYLKEKGNSIATQNQRLAAIKCFFRYVQYAFPEYLNIATEILQMRMKKQPKQTVNYMSVDGVACVLRQPDLSTPAGYKDALMLTILYDSGARVSEITQICVGDIRLHPPATVLLHGKGRKDRIVPISSKTAALIEVYLQQMKLSKPMCKDKFLFTNRSGEQLTRAGVSYILRKYVDSARIEKPELIPARFSPHCMRHSKAMHLLQAGVATIYIRDFLGHESVKTTEVYAKVDSKSKHAALEAAYSAVFSTELPKVSWVEDDDLMKFLANLCSG